MHFPDSMKYSSDGSNRLLRSLPLLYLLLSTSPAQPARIPDAAELHLALEKLNVLGSALYVAAHPDDENSALLAYWSKGKLVRAAYLSMTRGEGGQNLLGPEQGELMGVIRTQELLAARTIDGAEQFFTRAIDFGYSKTSGETMGIWGKEKILSDVVWVIRKFRPDVIVTRFSPTIGGHGNHTSSAILAEEAFRVAADPKRFPEQLKYVEPWQPKRILFNFSRFFSPTSVDSSKVVSLDLGEYSPLLGRSFTEVAGMSRSMHKSQGVGAPQSVGANINSFVHTGGEPAASDMFDGVNLTWSRIEGGEAVGAIIRKAIKEFNPEKPADIVPELLDAYRHMNGLHDRYWADIKKKELLDVIKWCMGLWTEAITTDYSAVPGGHLRVNVMAINRSAIPMMLDSVSILHNVADTLLHVSLFPNNPVRASWVVTVPKTASYTQPYWLREQPGAGSYNVTDQTLIGAPENPARLVAQFFVTVGLDRLVFESPFQHRWVDPVEGEIYRPLEIAPPVALNLLEHVYVFSGMKDKKVEVAIKSGSAGVSGKVRLKAPHGWTVDPVEISFELRNKNDEEIVTFHVRSSDDAQSGGFRAEAEVGGATIANGIRTIQYKHIPPQTVFPLAEGRLLRIDLKIRGQSIGYIMGAGDEIPTALSQMGYSVTLLSDDDLSGENLSKYDAIVAGVRAYNTRPKLRIHQKRLMEYVGVGGTYIVQYVTPQRGESENLGPYAFNVSRDRVTVEDSPVTFLNPQSPLLNSPNKITHDDFGGWIQERGLYFADKWDPKYETVIACNDPDEPSKAGGMLVAKYGKGFYVYTGYSFFRQLPAGVTGAYRLFANLVSLGK